MFNASAASWRFIFVVGCGHSGTTLLATMLGAHRACYVYSEETELFWRSNNVTASAFLRFGLRIAQDLGHDCFVEKTPRHVHKIARIREALPEARVVAAVRDPRDVVASLMRRGADFAGALQRWRSDNQALLAAYEQQPLATLRYEDLVAEPERICRQLCGELGLSYDGEMLAYDKHAPSWYDDTMKSGANSHEARRSQQMHQPLQDFRGVYRDRLSAQQVSEIEREAGELMAVFGYTPSS